MSRSPTVCDAACVPESNVVGLRLPSEALTLFSMLNWNEFRPWVRLASTFQSPLRRTPIVTPRSLMVLWISGKKPSGWIAATFCVV